MNKIAVFGSAFNPPSLGHKSVIESLSHFDQVLLLPSISHAWGKQMLDYTLRCQLVDAFVRDLSATNVERSDVEEHLVQPDTSVTTYAVLQALELNYPDSQLTFVIGPDNLFNFAKFYRAEEILRRWSLLSCPEKVAVRSTDIRHALSHQQDISHLTTPSVAKLLAEHQYY
ncbi:nicotinate-nicotinamide nucleotide adenylyltransferase [Vibrio sp. JPW-9-11-11]|uniref:nicotinate-nicotinamide nucleotide adenylyltransferase n=1 Tax=Vibrio sp. JPW-9-11-11 TaxID=1416532 RepID=UPI0015930246|nr:nicotinate-nicotinamide nucleotide adenylyltransferase [Vibrio sp. JPW-9-11-11]NVD08891.1 nicotinate-nicotinamide nucleotide adenylyltransferase [Vibrio sp. JPW-9-11-11]